MATIQPDDKTIIKRSLGAQVHIYSAGIARLYTATSKHPSGNLSWQYTNLQGAIILLRDAQCKNASFFRLMDLGSGKVVWEIEIYEELDYVQDHPCFHYFDGEKSLIGLLFATEQEARAFADCYRRKIVGRKEETQMSMKNILVK